MALLAWRVRKDIHPDWIAQALKPRLLHSLIFALGASLLCAGCGDADDEPATVSVIGSAQEGASPLTYADTRAGQVMLAATARGLVSLDADGTVIPALAQRWIVVDDGMSYIFRLRRARWADGAKVDAREVKQLLQARLRAHAKTDPYGPLSSVEQIVAMTDDVLEIRLAAPRPNFLVALAEADMAVARGTGGSGPYRKTRMDVGLWRLMPINLVGKVDEDAPRRDIRLLRAEKASRAIVRYGQNGADLVLGGTIAELPYVSIARINDNAMRFDPVQGLFGLALSAGNPKLDDLQIRRALAMALDRTALVSSYNIARWRFAEQIMPQQLNLPHSPTPPDWVALPMDRRQALARDIISRWKIQHEGQDFTLTISLPDGPGMDILFAALRAQYRQAGITLHRVEKGADISLIDEVAPYDSAAWYLGRLSCARAVHCDPEAEELLKASRTAPTMEERLQILGQAEPLIAAHEGFIPIATPVRWSLVRRRLDGFAPSPRAEHPLDHLMK